MPEYFFIMDNVDVLSNKIILETENVKNNSLSFMQIISAIYIVGVILSFVKMFFNIHKINKIKKGKKFEIIDNVKIIYTEENHIPFSFFNCIYLPDEINNPLILKHEMSHVKNHHSLDVILMEMMISFQWFNPYIYKMKKELQNVHEYIADNEAVEDETDKSNYMMLLLQQCTADNFNTVANNFSFLLTKKRISMITQKQKTKRMVIRMLLTLPVFAMLILLNTQCDNPKSNAETNVSKEQVSVENSEGQDCDSIYIVVETMPQFPGGPNELMKYLSENTKYPESAKANKIEGRVFVSFVIEKDGSVTNAEVMRGIDKECDAEAVRVVSSMPKWQPGTQNGEAVRCRFTVPFIFKLNDSEK